MSSYSGSFFKVLILYNPLLVLISDQVRRPAFAAALRDYDQRGFALGASIIQLIQYIHIDLNLVECLLS